jgi:Aminotransferase class-V
MIRPRSCQTTNDSGIAHHRNREGKSWRTFICDRRIQDRRDRSGLNREGIAVRSGHHCAQPILRRFGLESSVRASLALHNTCEEIDALVAALWNLRQGRQPALQ